ncbi:MAG: hypothetical protein D6790_07675 [Caldilineae bacterium]|nr:MAG: hypothetical protein D6790_07675 [Caldilineae bacterium]
MDSFFGIGPLEFVFILIFALIFLGPERLPTVVRQIAQFITQVRELSSQITEQLNQEFGDLKELDPRWQLEQLAKETEKDKKPAKKTGGSSSAKTAPRKTTSSSSSSTGASKPAASSANAAQKRAAQKTTPPKTTPQEADAQVEKEEASPLGVNGKPQAAKQEPEAQAEGPSQPGPDDQVSPASQYFLDQQAAADNASTPPVAPEPEEASVEASENSIAPPHLQASVADPEDAGTSNNRDGQAAHDAPVAEREPKRSGGEEDQT